MTTKSDSGLQWNQVESNDKYKKHIHQHKLRCVYIESKEAEAATTTAPAAAAAAAPVTHHLTSFTPATTAPATADTNVSRGPCAQGAMPTNRHTCEYVGRG